MKLLLLLSFATLLFTAGCAQFAPEEEFSTLPVTNNPYVIPESIRNPSPLG